MKIVLLMLTVFCALFLVEGQSPESDVPTPYFPESGGGNPGNLKCGPKEKVYKCGVPCPETCEYVNKKPQKKPCGPKACGCIKGYVRDMNNVCVSAKYYCTQDQNNSTDEEPPKQCPPNQKYYKCGLPCPQTCHFVNQTCKFRRNFECNPKRDGVCGCIEKCVRNDKNKCVPADEYCDPNENGQGSGRKCKGRHEVFSECANQCGQTCETLNLACPAKCKLGGACICRPGYVRNNQHKCVRADRYCNQTVTCGSNEVFSSCAPLCERMCNVMIKCIEGCEPKCICRDGFIRDSNNRCILESKCPPLPGEECVGEHKVFSKCCKPSECMLTCEHPKNDISCPEAACIEGCVCEDGFLINANGECIKEEYCPGDNSTQCDDPLKEYNSCGTQFLCIPTCENPINNAKCILNCNPGCFCKEGYLINKDGKCIKASECPPIDPNQCVGDHKVYMKCGMDEICLPTCENPNNTNPCTKNCVQGCFCEEGYLVDENGDCVPEDQCSSPPQKECLGDHQYYDSCGKPPGCYPTCEDPSNNGFGPEGCYEDCYCEAGYLMNKAGKCVTAEECEGNSSE